MGFCIPDRGRTVPSLSMSSIVLLGYTITPEAIVLLSIDISNTKVPSARTERRVSCSSPLIPKSPRFAISIIFAEGSAIAGSAVFAESERFPDHVESEGFARHTDSAKEEGFAEQFVESDKGTKVEGAARGQRSAR